MKRIVEIVCCSLQDCIDAARSGARRIELCSMIEAGGLTPSAGLLRMAKASVPIPVMVMIRPRPGGFCYAESEFDTMLADCDALSGADGFVFGVLKPDLTIDEDRCARLVEAAGNKQKVFHRAFDIVPDPLAAVESLIALGFDRILTSGQAPSAHEGIGTLDLLIRAAAGRIEVMPGGGLRSSNIEEVLALNCESVHLAPRRELHDPTGGSPFRVVDREEVLAVVKAAESATMISS